MKFHEFTPIDLGRASNQQLDLVNAAIDKKTPEIWRDIAEFNFVALRFNPTFDDLTDQLLADAAAVQVYQLISAIGGTQPYLPRGRSMSVVEKHAQIAREYRGNNINQLAAKHSLSEGRIRQIVQEQVDLKKAKQQQHGGQ